MDQTLTDFNRIKELIRTNIESADELSKLGIELASLRSTVGESAADAELAYSTEVVKAVAPDEDGKKLTIAESQRIADVSTGCERERLSHRLESIDELMNMVKVRIRVLGVEERQA